MTKMTRRQMDRASWIVVGVVCVASIGYLMLFFLPRMHAIADSQNQLDTKLAYVLDSQKSARITEQMQRDLDNVLAYIDQQDGQFTTREQLPALFSRISDISKAHNTITTRFEPQPPLEYETFRQLSLNLGVSGPFADVYRVARDLEGLPTRVWIEDLKFRAPSEAGKPVECEMFLVVFVDNPEKTD